jgi:hypothetical protein
MTTGTWLTLNVRCASCGQSHVAERRATRVDCNCGTTFDPATRPTGAAPRASSDDRLRSFRRRLRESVVLNDRVSRVFALIAFVAWGAFIATGSAISPLWLTGAVATLGWLGFHLLGRKVESGAWLRAHARLWSLFSSISRDAARRARRLDREARELREMGLSINSQTERNSK